MTFYFLKWSKLKKNVKVFVCLITLIISLWKSSRECAHHLASLLHRKHSDTSEVRDSELYLQLLWCSVTLVLRPKEWQENLHRDQMFPDETDTTSNVDQSTNSSQPRMIIDAILIQIELNNKDSVAIDARPLLPSNKGNHARPNAVPSAGERRGLALPHIEWDQYPAQLMPD